MRVPQLQYTLLLSFLLVISFAPSLSLQAQEGMWVRRNYDYTGIFQPLSGYEEWNFNTTRGPHDRWVINLTISGYDFNPTTVLVCHQRGYDHWKSNGSTSQCSLAEAVNITLDTSVDLTEHSTWYCVLNNTGAVSLFYTIFITHYQWITEPTSSTPPDPTSIFSGYLGYLIIAIVITFLVIPCLCNYTCIGRWRRGSQKKNTNQEIHHYYYLAGPLEPEPATQTPDDEDEYW